jgi:hypothetical protein
VLGTKAGRERYAEIVKVAQRISQRLDELGARDDESAAAPGGFGTGDAGGDFDTWEREETLRGSRPEGFGESSFAGPAAADVGRDRPHRAG